MDKSNEKVQEYNEYLKHKAGTPTKDGLMLITESNASMFLESPFIFDEVEQETELKTNINAVNISTPSRTINTIMPVIPPLPGLDVMRKESKQTKLNDCGLPML